MRTELSGLRHGKERFYGTLVLVFGASIWLVALVAVALAFARGRSAEFVVFIVEIAVIMLVLLLVKMFYRAWLFGHAVLIGPQQLPRLYDSLRRGAEKLGMREVPQAFLYNSNGLMNAFAMRVLNRRMVLLTSALIDVENDAQVDFVVGHELGHHVAGHLTFSKNLLKYPGYFIPFLGAAYHRGRELTADRIGAFCVGDAETARSALHMLACGSARLNAAMNADAFAAQETQVPAVTGFLLHVFSGYPRLTRRVREVERFLGAGPAGGQQPGFGGAPGVQLT